MKNQKSILLANTFGTPLYVYDVNVILAQLEKLKHATGADIFYSLKTSPNLDTAQCMLSHGAHAEVCSLAELNTALEAGFKSNNIIFVGPYKQNEELILAIKLGVFAIVCESIHEMQRINNMAGSLHKKANILMRIIPDFSVESAPLKMGIAIKDLPDTLSLTTYPNLNLRGIYIYNESSVHNVHEFIKNTNDIFELSDVISQRLKIKFDALNLGGCFGNTYFNQENNGNIQLLTMGLSYYFSAYKLKNPKVRLMINCDSFSEQSHSTEVLLAVKKIHLIQERDAITDVS